MKSVVLGHRTPPEPEHVQHFRKHARDAVPTAELGIGFGRGVHTETSGHLGFHKCSTLPEQICRNEHMLCKICKARLVAAWFDRQ